MKEIKYIVYKKESLKKCYVMNVLLIVEVQNLYKISLCEYEMKSKSLTGKSLKFTRMM